MPNLQEFDAGNLSLRPTEVGVEARAGTARRIGMFYNQTASAQDMLARETSRLAGETSKLGSETAALGAEKGAALADTGRRLGSSIEAGGAAAVQYLEHRDISQGAQAWARLTQQKTEQWDETVKHADPNDPTVAQKFLDGLEPELAKFKEDGFLTEGGQKWAEAHVDALRQHMVEKTQADMATLAGHAAVVNQQQTVNSLSATVHSDPASLDFSLAALKSSTEGLISSSPNLSGTQAAAARSEILQKGAEAIVKSAAIGYIDKTAQIPPWATDPKYAPYIKGDELQMLEKAAKTQAKANAYYDKQTQITQRQLADLNVHQGATKVITDNVKVDPQNGSPVVAPKFFKDVLDLARQNPDAPSAAATARTMLDWGESQQNKERKPVDDPAVRQGLTDRLFDPDKPTTRIDLMKAQTAGKLSDHSFTAMERLVTELEQAPLKGPVWQATAAAVKDSLIVSVPGIPGKDTKGTENYSSFMQSFIPQYLAKSRAGTLPPNALDVKDPNSMISQAMAPFKRTPSQRMSDYVAGAGGLGGGPTAAARKVGDVPVPAALGGIAALQFNPTTKQWRDQTSGIIYDSAGQPVTR